MAISSSPAKTARRSRLLHFATSPVGGVCFRLALLILAAAISGLLLNRKMFGEFGVFFAFFLTAAASWYSGPLISLLGPLIILNVDRFQRLEWAAFSTRPTGQEFSNWLFFTLVMFTIAWAGKLTRKSLAELRQREARLREEAQHKDRFLATLAHELRNPLSPLQSAVEVLQMTSDAPPNPAVLREVHQTMRRQIEHLVHLVDDLLDINRISAGKIKLALQPTSLTQIVRDAVAAARPALEEAKHRVALKADDPEIFVQGDRTRLLQVLLNLLNNAAKFTPPGGNIRVEAIAGDKMAAITVTDTGIGIAPEELPRVFEMFAQIENPLSEANRGLGIGLSLSQRFIEMHGGTIEVLSDGPGKGSQFVVRLPLAQKTEEGKSG